MGDNFLCFISSFVNRDCCIMSLDHCVSLTEIIYLKGILLYMSGIFIFTDFQFFHPLPLQYTFFKPHSKYKSMSLLFDGGGKIGSHLPWKALFV